MVSRSFAYGFINAKLRARIGAMLPREWMLRMAGAPSLTEAVAMLDKTPYEEAWAIYQRTGDIKLVEAQIVRIERQDVLSLKKQLMSAAAGLTQALILQYEVETVKNALRLWFARAVAGRTIDEAVAYVDRDSVRDSFSVDAVANAGDTTAVLAAFEGTPYQETIADQLPHVIERQSLFPLELGLDRWYFGRLNESLESLDRTDRAIARRLLGIRIDMVNLHWIARIKEYYRMTEAEAMSSLLPGGATFDTAAIQAIYRSDSPSSAIAGVLAGRYGGPAPVAGDVRRLALLSSVLQEVLLHEVRRVLGGYPFTVGVILAYLFLRQNEARAITTVINARYYELSASAIGSLI